MSFPFLLPTTSILNYTLFLRSDTHPSLIVNATTLRSLLRNVLKRHRRLSVKDQAQNLQNVTSALEEYIPYLLTIDSGLSGKTVSDEFVSIILEKEIEVEWRPSIAASDSKRTKGRGLDFELSFTLNACAYVDSAQARAALHIFHTLPASASNERKDLIKQATERFIHSASLHQYLAGRNADLQFPPGAVDLQSASQTALSCLALAEATLLSILLHDPYPSIVVQERDTSDKEWMYKAPDIPKVRAALFARLAIRAAEHSEKALALFNDVQIRGRSVDGLLLKYISNLQAVSKARGCRFFGIEAEIGGQVGEGIAWLMAGKKLLGYKVNESEGGKVKAIDKMKIGWAQKREDKRIEKGADWGTDAGRLEETRVIDMLLKKWNKTNDLVRTFFDS